MSPSSSAIPHKEPSISRTTAHSRKASATAIPNPTQERRPSIQPPQPLPDQSPLPQKHHVHYTVFIRLPFPRKDFEDPPPVEWDTAKDKQLWKLISKASNSKELDWEEMSVRFDVTLSFLLQQAAWLYERHFESMKAQMKRLGAAVPSGTASPALDGGSGTGTGNEGVGKSTVGSRAPSNIVTQRNSPLPVGEIGSLPGTPRSARLGVSRTPSTATVTQSRVLAPSPRQLSQRGARGSSGSQRRPQLSMRPVAHEEDDDTALGLDATSESDSEEEPSALARSQAFKRTQLSKKPTMATLSSDGDAEDDGDDSSGGYLPFAAGSKGTKADPAATLRTATKRQPTNIQAAAAAPTKAKAPEQPPGSSASSASSAQQPPPPSGPGPLSPRQRAELEKLSPRHKKSGSDGSPSMGSSFSDLDDASVTQSALEDALLSNMQHGSIGMGSRISTLREALGRK